MLIAVAFLLRCPFESPGCRIPRLRSLSLPVENWLELIDVLAFNRQPFADVIDRSKSDLVDLEASHRSMMLDGLSEVAGRADIGKLAVEGQLRLPF